MPTLEPPPRVPPAKVVPEDLVDKPVKDVHDTICAFEIPGTADRCTRVALYDLVFENGCLHTDPCPVCLPHKDLYEWAINAGVAVGHEIGCAQCDPPIVLGRPIRVQLLREYGQ